MNKILDNIKIVLTRTKNQSVESIRLLENLGANVISFPTIKIATVKDNAELNEVIKKINYYNTLIFTSENAVRSLMEKIDELEVKFDPNAFFVISIGDKTSSVLLEYGYRIDFQSNKSTSDALLKELGSIELIGRKILIPMSNLSKLNQFNPLEDHGAIIHPIPIYYNTVNDKENLKEKIEELKNNNIDLFIFTSPSTFNGFLEIMNVKNPIEYFDKKTIAVIGPVTQKALLNIGIKPTIMPSNYTMNNLIEEIKLYFRKTVATS